jgi:hypothetical protein
MSLNLNNEGFPLCKISSSKKSINNKVVYFSNDNEEDNELNKTFTELQLPNKSDEFTLYPSDETRSIVVTGAQKAGKSWWVSAYLENYVKVNKDCKVIIISEKKHDAVFDEKFKHLKDKGLLTRPDYTEWIDNPITNDDIEILPANTIFVFDDVDTISHTKVKKVIYDLADKLFALYRSRKLNIIFSQHLNTTGKEGKIRLTNADALVFFPSVVDEYFMKRYMSLKKNVLKQFQNGEFKSRWCVFVRGNPSILLFQNLIKVLI